MPEVFEMIRNENFAKDDVTISSLLPLSNSLFRGKVSKMFNRNSTIIDDKSRIIIMWSESIKHFFVIDLVKNS